MGDATPEQRILARLGLAQLTIGGQLALLLKRFRTAQLNALEDTIRALPDHIITHIQAYFDRKLDVKDEFDRYTQDLVKTTHLVHHFQLDNDAQREIEVLMGALGDGGDRALLLKLLQTLGARLVGVFSSFCLQLSQIKLQQEFYRVFATAESGTTDLKTWMQWLDSCQAKRPLVTEFLTKCTIERCLAQWLKLLSPLVSPVRITLIERLANTEAAVLKQIGRFHEVTSLSIATLLDLCSGFQTELPMLLSEFPMATTLTLYAKFNDDQLIAIVVKTLYVLGIGEVIRLVDSLAAEENVRAIKVFFISMATNERRRDIISLYFSLPKLSQSRLVALILQAACGIEDEGVAATGESGDPSIVYAFLLDGHLHSIDDVLRKLSSLPNDKISVLMNIMRQLTIAELVLIGEGIEAILDLHCLESFFRLFQLLLPAQRSILVDWVHDMPGTEGLKLYDKLFQLHANSQQDKLAALLKMMASLKKTDKFTLCTRLLRHASGEEDTKFIKQTNEAVLNYLCECDPSRLHKCVNLLDATENASFDALLFLLRSQRIPEQVALTKVMLALSPGANGRLLTKLQGLGGDTLDEFFQLLMLIPKGEYKMLSRLLASQEVSLHHFENFVHIAANMMNQAASREMVTFAAELPPWYRNMFFDILGQCTSAEKGVVMRVVACSTRLSAEMLQLFVELLLRMPWETRSALVEQLRSLEDPMHIQTYLLVLRDFDDDTCLPRLVHLLNLLTIPVRTSLVLLFAQMNSRPERVQALVKLNAMRKDQMPLYCTALCDPQHLHLISCSYLRVLGYMQDEYHAGMLKLLPRKSCWVFIDVLAETMDATISNADRDEWITPNSALVNGLSASLTLLNQEDDFNVLGDVMEEAMENGIRLEELIIVFAHFRDRDRLLVFLNYARHLARFARSTLLFRVLSRSQETTFLFDMCHVMDVDDALFALKRLDRIWSREGSAVDNILVSMARNKSAVESKDEFCNLVLGYRERTPLRSESRYRAVDRVVIPRSQPEQCQSSGESNISRSRSDGLLGSYDECIFDLAAIPTDSNRPLSTTKHLERVRDKREDARRRRRYRHWRKWTQADWDEVLETTDQRSIEDSQEASRRADRPIHSQIAQLIDTSAPSEHLANSSEDCIKEVCEMTDVDSTPTISQLEADDGHFSASSASVLPPISNQLPSVQGSSRPPSGQNNRPSGASSVHQSTSNSTRELMRSESAPTGLHPSCMSRTKQYRGLHAALEVQEADANHVPRDQGANIFHSQCKHVIAHGPSRIRFAHTEAAHSKILAARVDKSLGRRSSSLLQPPSSLQRSERYTIEQATLAIAHGEQVRSQGARDFVEWT